MKIQILCLTSLFIAASSCQTKQRKEEGFSGAQQQIAGADSKAGAADEQNATDSSTEKGLDSNPVSILFRVTGGDESNSDQAVIVYQCADGYSEEVTLDLDQEGEASLVPHNGSTDCTISLNSFQVGGNAYLPMEGEEFPSFDVGEMGVFNNANSQYSVMVVAQLPGSEVHYQYSTMVDEDIEVIEDDSEQDNPNQSPSQK